MIDRKKIAIFKEIFDKSDSILIMCSNNATRDQLFAATSLYMVLKENAQKSVKLLCPEDFSKEENDIIGLGDVQTEIGHENLCITLDFIENSIDKVNYHTNEETKKFYLTINPKKGFPPLSKNNVKFSYTGAEADMIILIGVNDLESLEKLYFGYEKLYEKATVASINSYETDFGNYKLDTAGTSGFSEFIAQLIISLQIPFNQSSATNLLSGIEEETDGFESYVATADTFEIASKLMRSGARRVSRSLVKDNKIVKDKVTVQKVLKKK